MSPKTPVLLTIYLGCPGKGNYMVGLVSFLSVGISIRVSEEIKKSSGYYGGARKNWGYFLKVSVLL
jgi:hypothetical protein